MTKNEQLTMEIKDLNQQLSTRRVNSLGQEQADGASPLNSHDQVHVGIENKTKI